MDLSGLNKEQRIAAETLEGPVLILAGAGSGKTRALTYRLANLVQLGVPAGQILALTFTNKAANEMKMRIENMTGADAVRDAWISTFHSACARILRRDIEKLGYKRSFVIYDEEDTQKVIKGICKELNLSEEFIPAKEVRNKISGAKNKMMNPDEWFNQTTRDYRSNRIHDVMTEYEKKMRAMNALDFDDLLLKTLELFAGHPPVLQSYQNRFRYVMVDEYQDTNRAQYELVRLITLNSRNLCVVGDDDQSIYGWRGADIRNILDFEEDYPEAKVIRLEQNYRSTTRILDAANQVIAHNEGRKDKKLWTENGEGNLISVYRAKDDHDEGIWIARKIQELRDNGADYGSCAILYRANSQSRVPEEMLMRSSIPYKVFGGQKFYERKEVKDILAYLRVIANPADDISLMRIINVPRRSIGETTVQTLVQYAAEQGIPLFSALSDLPESLGSRARTSVNDFFRMMTLLCAMKENMGPEELTDLLIEKTGLEEQYIRENTDEARDRLENMNEFRNALHDYVQGEDHPTLEGYLENVALVTDLDRETGGRNYVTMMTLHSAKGLEFDNVFIPGLEENIFPSARSMQEEDRLEEERRLMYVGITRARKRLFLSYAYERVQFYQINHNPQSRFLKEIPERLKDSRSYDEGFVFSHGRSYSTGKERKAIQESWEEEPFMRKTPISAGQLGKPKLTFRGKNLDEIPGVSKGFVPSKAREETSGALQSLFRPGERINHPKLGKGTVEEITGSGKDIRIHISFDQAGRKELALASAPIVRLEEDEI